MLVWFDFIFLGDLNKCFPHFRSFFFFFPSLTCSWQQCYICILFLLTVFKEERANLQYNRQSGAMFQDEKSRLFINLWGSHAPAQQRPSHRSQSRLLVSFQISAENLLCTEPRESFACPRWVSCSQTWKNRGTNKCHTKSLLICWCLITKSLTKLLEECMSH